MLYRNAHASMTIIVYLPTSDTNDNGSLHPCYLSMLNKDDMIIDQDHCVTLYRLLEGTHYVVLRILYSRLRIYTRAFKAYI